MNIFTKVFTKKWVQIVSAVIVFILTVYTVVYFDITSRAKEAYLEAEKYQAWHTDPQLKVKQLEEQYTTEKKALEKRLNPSLINTILGVKKLTKEELAQQVDAIEFEHTRRLNESSIKYAYVWYQTCVELFSPPESKWVKLSREKMPAAKELWKAELRAKKIPFEDYMLD
ncbi:MAG: hypothetical protein WC955_00390 [Elusimicrobiota bacterium]